MTHTHAKGQRCVQVQAHLVISSKVRVETAVSYTHLTLPTNREV